MTKPHKMNQSDLNNTLHNNTFDQQEEGMRDNVLGGTLFGINICIVFLNSLALMVIMRFRSKNCIDVLVLGLALTDLIKGLIPVPMSVCIYLSSWHLREDTVACEFFGWIAFTTNSASMLILTMMAIERFVAIAKPFAYRSLITKKRMEITVLIAVLFSAFLSVLPVIGVGKMIPYNDGAYCHFDYNDDSISSKIYSIFVLIYGFSLTIIVMAAYSVVFYKIRDLIKRHRKFSVARLLAKVSVTDGKQKKDINLKVEKMFSYLTVGLMLLFWFSWLPFLVVVFASQTGLQTPHDKVDLFAIRVAVVNAMLNPLACASFCKPYRRGFFYYYKKMLSYAGFARPNSDVFDPWRQRSQMATREPTPGNSLTMPNESRYSRYRPFNDNTDSGFASSTWPRFSGIQSNLEPMQQDIRQTEKCGENERELKQQLNRFSHISPLEESDEELDIAVELNGKHNAISAENLKQIECKNRENVAEIHQGNDRIGVKKRSPLIQDDKVVKRYSIPLLNYCARPDKQERPKSLDCKIYSKYRPWSFGLRNDLRYAIYKQAQNNEEDIKLISYKKKNSDAQNNEECLEKDYSCFDDQGRSKDEKNIDSSESRTDVRVAKKALLVKAESFSSFDKNRIGNIERLSKGKEFSQASRERQSAFGKKRSKSNPANYNPKIYSNDRYLSLQNDLYESLHQIDTVAKDLLLLSGSKKEDEVSKNSELFSKH